MYVRFGKTSIFLFLFLAVNFLTFFLNPNFVLSHDGSVRKIAMLGDSLTQGYGLMPADNLVAQLQGRLFEDNYPVDLLNFGVSGDTTAGGLARFDWSVSSDIDGVVIILGGNDLLRGIAPDHSFENLTGMITKAKSRNLPVLLVGMRASSNFGSAYKTEFDTIFSRLNNKFDIFYYPNFFNALNPEDIPLFLSSMQNDGIHPNANGIKKIVDDMYPTFLNFLDSLLKIN